MTAKEELAKQRVSAVYPDAWEHKQSGTIWVSEALDGDEEGYLGDNWQNAAESLPAGPEQKVVYDAWGKAGRLQPVAPVGAKEKERCPGCGHKNHYALRCGALIATGSDGDYAEEVRCECLNWVAEPKPTPSTPAPDKE